MDWNALGTWAAVFVALAISVRDIIERRRQRTAQHLITSAQILPDVARLRDVLSHIVEESAMFRNNTNAELVFEAIDSYAAQLKGMGLRHLRGKADQVDALPEGMLIPLVKALSVSDMLLENYDLQRSQAEEGDLDMALSELSEWQEQCASIKASLDWVVQGAEQKLRSRRWRHPEQWP